MGETPQTGIKTADGMIEKAVRLGLTVAVSAKEGEHSTTVTVEFGMTVPESAEGTLLGQHIAADTLSVTWLRPTRKGARWSMLTAVRWEFASHRKIRRVRDLECVLDSMGREVARRAAREEAEKRSAAEEAAPAFEGAPARTFDGCGCRSCQTGRGNCLKITGATYYVLVAGIKETGPYNSHRDAVEGGRRHGGRIEERHVITEAAPAAESPEPKIIPEVPVSETPRTMGHAIDFLNRLKVGDRVRVTREGRTADLTVSMGPRRSDGAYGSPESTRVTVSYGVGRYSYEVEAGHLFAQKGDKGSMTMGGTRMMRLPAEEAAPVAEEEGPRTPVEAGRVQLSALAEKWSAAVDAECARFTGQAQEVAETRGESQCPKCGRELRTWPLDRGPVCAPKRWAYCIRPVAESQGVAATQDVPSAPAGVESLNLADEEAAMRSAQSIVPQGETLTVRTVKGEDDRTENTDRDDAVGRVAMFVRAGARCTATDGTLVCAWQGETLTVSLTA
ncbi:hypothetical protein QFZ75_008018 [Streptomyces sp. V3I8]|uniref:hypothetical protein n=1 Tax=Streptomyces sp. V3I8 TaxID=3042279 RepID=UPI00277F7957|nr:hypothetical protein [Streptomyces sp. V3I8]MDQ1041516.1 hypothetical protein [Streptomyces sp. V3I8]